MIRRAHLRLVVADRRLFPCPSPSHLLLLLTEASVWLALRFAYVTDDDIRRPLVVRGAYFVSFASQVSSTCRSLSHRGRCGLIEVVLESGIFRAEAVRPRRRSARLGPFCPSADLLPFTYRSRDRVGATTDTQSSRSSRAFATARDAELDASCLGASRRLTLQWRAGVAHLELRSGLQACAGLGRANDPRMPACLESRSRQRTASSRRRLAIPRDAQRPGRSQILNRL